jgi:BirA family biotin operon repressor/biotin-[acetyl-CoA-carboxylase] ligase
MSLAWRFDTSPADLGRLSLHLGLAIADALTSLGARGVLLKWPNDVFWQERKLGGILLEVAGRGRAATGYVVAGIGLNLNMPLAAAREIDQPWTDLATVMISKAPSRNMLAARMLDALVAAILSFANGGDTNLRHAWRRYDLTYGRLVELRTEKGQECGTAQGIDEQGRLLLQIDGRQRSFTSGDVTLGARSFEPQLHQSRASPRTMQR